MTFKAQKWFETHDGRPQCLYENEEGDKFVVRLISEFNWYAVIISHPTYMIGNIIAKSQSDIDCFNKAVEEINGKSSVTQKI